MANKEKKESIYITVEEDICITIDTHKSILTTADASILCEKLCEILRWEYTPNDDY